MSDGENHHHGKNEIVIIKRHGGGDHDGHHGGAWKIAYADFMTAMMAFFLVMWLVNAANEETKASVASYFNPIKLSDEKPTEKGLKKPVDQAEGEEKQERSTVKEEQETVGAAAATGEDQTATSGDQANYSEADFFENPYSVLAEIAQEVGQQANVSAKGEGGASDSGPSTGAEGGEAYRDPFDPDFWTQQVQTAKGEPGTPRNTELPTAEQATAEESDVAPNQEVAVAVPTPRPESADEIAAKDKDKDADPSKPVTPQDVADRTKEFDKEKNADAEALRDSIETAIGGVTGKLAEGLIVMPAEGGLLVTITDQADTPMFNVGSAVPRKELVVAMEKIGKILEARKGSILIRGHTDGRQFKGTENDNWRLSMARAHSAYYMLVRGGLSEKRVSQVSGYADRRLQVPENPLADANRRIEILIQADQG
ncbi:MotB family protein [Agrobacterium sp. a22-2]|uniref:MotB family protein n=1 Tax=Agrobacterium sp. a22-2 TaxID=2283840 RepID=UPI001446858D|nr:MotB family protein [Agrobacterium sp. a22-2]NKN34819.1 MotB family protein [Agrobacterium sp. a22-2]